MGEDFSALAGEAWYGRTGLRAMMDWIDTDWRE